MSVDKIIDATIGKEGRYSNHPNDTGGATMWGITERVARRNGYKGSMRNLPRTTAAKIYKDEYYNRPGFNQIEPISVKLAEELFDTGVNMGPGRPALWLQEWLNAFNNQGTLYGDIVEDGDIGPATIRALKAFFKTRGAEAEKVMLNALNADQAVYYKTITRGRPKNEAFTYGWLRTRVE